MQGSLRRRLVSLLGVLSCGAALAQAAAPAPAVPEVPLRQVQYHEHHVLQPDGRTTSTYRATTRVLSQTGLDDARQASVQVSRSAQTLQVLEAYTLKADGRRLTVPRASWQVRRSTGREGQPPVFSDQDSTTLVFPEVAVGDSVVLAYRIATKQPLFPGKVALANSFSRAQAFDDVKVVVDAPAAMPLKTRTFEMTASESVARGRRVLTWTWRHPDPVPDTRQDWSVVDVGAQPGYLLSSFDDWDDVARSYVRRASPKAAVTPAVRELSDRVAGGHDSVAAKARALHEWVATQVGYAGNCVGIGAVVPRDLAVVLKHRLGDCKDHATLLQALLAAQGIASHQVLVNAGSIYRLPDVPVAGLVNHVISYIPALDTFVDATDDATPFGRLPMSLYDKPVLSDAPGVPRRIPSDPGGHGQTMATTLSVGDDGAVEGRVEITMTGLDAIRSRAMFRRLDAPQRREFVKNVFRQSGLQADGTLDLDDPAPLADSRALPFPGAGGLGVFPWFYSEAPVGRWAQHAMQPPEDVESVCGAGRSTETYDITLPASMQVLSVPESLSADDPILAYAATYRLDGRRLTVRRELTDRTPAGLCSAATMRQFHAATQVVLKDMRQQLLYR